MLVSSGLKSVSALLIASTAVIVPPAASKFVTERRGQAVGVRALVVDRGGRGEALLRVDEVGHDRALDLVVVRGAQVERLVRPLGRQTGVRVRRRDQQDALVGQDLVGDTERGARAARSRSPPRSTGRRRAPWRPPDHPRPSRGRPPAGQRRRVAERARRPFRRSCRPGSRWPASTPSALSWPSERRVAADRQQRADGDRRTSRHLDAAELDRVAVDGRHRVAPELPVAPEASSSLEQAARRRASNTLTRASSRKGSDVS